MKLYINLVLVTLFLFSCRDEDFDSISSGGLQPVDFKVHVKYDTDYQSLPSQGALVKIINLGTNDEYTSTSDVDGTASFEHIVPGTYTVTVAKIMSATEYQTTFGSVSPADEMNFNGAQDNVTINLNVPSTSVVLKAAKVGDLVIKQIYYAGSHSTNGASYRDQFIEIYNNSNQTIYADGLYIGQLYGKSNLTTDSYTLANGQYDWSKSMGMTIGAFANTDYVYADYVIKVPGNGTDYPILPGESIVIAQNALNHKAPLLDNSGTPITIINPTLTVDLSDADFEVHLGPFRQSIGLTVNRYDIQNPAIPDMDIAYWGIPGYYSGNVDFLMDNPGRDSFIIFRSDNFDLYKAYTDPSVVNVVSSSKYFKQIPTNIIIDGVELQNFNANSKRPKMLDSSIDASEIACDASFNSQAIIRKTKATVSLPNVGSRKILVDTNNSASDFVKIQASPRSFAP